MMPAKSLKFVCPRDGTHITSRVLGGPTLDFNLHECPACKGMWLDRGELQKLMHDSEVEDLLRDYAAPARNPIPCPRDGEPMERRRIEDVEVDLCESCGGFWLDRGELEPLEDRVHEVEEENRRAMMSRLQLSRYDISLMTLLSPGMLERLESGRKP